MPTIAQFGGITIHMYYRPKEHPPPHFHADYGDNTASYDIRTRRVTAGKLPGAQHRQVLKWAAVHQAELLEKWELVMAGQAPGKIL